MWSLDAEAPVPEARHATAHDQLHLRVEAGLAAVASLPPGGVADHESELSQQILGF